MKNLVVSGVNIDSGGALSIYMECLQKLDDSSCNVTALVHNKSLFMNYKNINFIEIPKAKKNYFYRCFYEYIYFYFISLKLKPDIWLSIHDMTPNVKAKIRAVYCHNPAPFYKMSRLEKKLDKKMRVFNLFYKYIYKINLSKNNYIIVQQNWIADKFVSDYKINIQKIIVLQPEVENYTIDKNIIYSFSNARKQFFYPAFPRSFKNFEVICNAADYLLNNTNLDFEIILTIAGNENSYSKYIYDKYKNNGKIKFIGLIDKKIVYDYYNTSDCLIFPSKLETWGLPISEYKSFYKPILVADTLYARETVGKYENVEYFGVNDYIKLATLMMRVINNSKIFTAFAEQNCSYMILNSWQCLFKHFL